MTRHPDITFTTEYIKNVLYFATVRIGKKLYSTSEVHYFCIDNELLYENYYSDFGPLNLGCVFKYCKILNEKIKQYLNKQTIVHYTSIDPKKKANAAFLIGCYGVLYLSLLPRDALKPLLVHGQSYRPFQDATQGDSGYTISLMDCLCAIKKAKELDFFNFQDFNYDEYERLDKLQGGDLNWIVPGKFLAFIGPVDYSVSLYHPPEMYIEYFLENNVKIVIRLNKRMYDGNVFDKVGILHYDLFFPDGSCPPRHIMLKFLQIAEESEGAIAVHCKAGLGRTGSLIGCYLIKHYRMTALEAIGWMRICRPGSVIGHQQEWLVRVEGWLTKQGNLYRQPNIYKVCDRRRMFQDTEKFPIHEFGIYSISEKMLKQKPVVLSKSPSPPPPIQRLTRSDTAPPPRPQASKIRDAPSKATEKDQYDWRMKSSKMSMNSKIMSKSREATGAGSKPVSRRGSGAGEPRTAAPAIRTASRCVTAQLSARPTKELAKEPTDTPLPTFRTTQGPVIKTLTDAKNFLLKSSMYGQNRDRAMNSLNPSITVTPHYSFRSPNYQIDSNVKYSNVSPSTFSTVSGVPMQPAPRRRLGLGRSPSPSPTPSPTRLMDHTRATNTTPADKYLNKDSKSALREALSRLKLCGAGRGRGGVGGGGSIGAASVGAASLGARREAPPAAPRAPSVRSDERPLATQGDMLNSIKFQRRFRDTYADKMSSRINEKVSLTSKPSIKPDSSRFNSPSRCYNTDFSVQREKTITSSTSKFYSPQRPTSPKGRMRTSFY